MVVTSDDVVNTSDGTVMLLAGSVVNVTAE